MVVALLPTPEIRGSHPTISKSFKFRSVTIEKLINKEEEEGFL